MISVIMPVYNTAQYLRQSVNSVIRQTYPDWELILIDDGSRDGSEKLCDLYAEQDSRIRVIHRTNSGPAAARNEGMKTAGGDYLLFLDSDDWLFPQAMEKSLEKITESGADMLIFDMQFEGDNYSWHEKSSLQEGIYDSKAILKQLAIPAIPPYACNKFCKKSLYEGVLFPEGEKWEDVATTFYPVSRAERIMVLPEPLYHYRQHDDAITKRAGRDKSIYKWRYRQYRKRYEFLEKNYPELSDAAIESLLKSGMLYWIYYLRGDDVRAARREVYSYICSHRFDNKPYGIKVRMLRTFFRISPAITSFVFRKIYPNGL